MTSRLIYTHKNYNPNKVGYNRAIHGANQYRPVLANTARFKDSILEMTLKELKQLWK